MLSPLLTFIPGREERSMIRSSCPVLGSYYLLKTALEVFILTEGGAE